MKKILFVIDEFYPIESAPSVRIHSFIKNLKEFQVSILGGSKNKIIKKKWHLIKRPEEKNLIGFIIFLLKINLKNIIFSTKKYDLTIISIPKYELLFSVPVLILLRKKFIIDIRDSFQFLDYSAYLNHFFNEKTSKLLGNFIKEKIIKPIFNLSLKNAKIITVANKGIKENLKEFSNVHLISNGVDTELFQRKNNKKQDNLINLVYIGNFAEKDKFSWILTNLSEFKNNFRLNLIGKGRNKNKIIQKLKDKNINFKDWGVIPHYKIPSILEQMDLGFIFRSGEVTESIPVSIYEFCSIGIPSLVNNKGVMAKFINKFKIGKTFNNQEELKTYLEILSKKPSKLNEFKNLPDIAKKEFSRETESLKFKELIKNI